MNLKKHRVLFVFSLAFFVITFSLIYIYMKGTQTDTPWKYQCIDTMKNSRDDARSWGVNEKTTKEIAREMEIIKNLGANCVALDTPYDNEFVPYLNLWVTYARRNNLHIWFRGNFSAWEGWFDRPKGMTAQEHLQNTKQFILSHPQLFEDGDIFTPAPEAENAWGNGYVSYNDYPLFRQFLIEEHQNADTAFIQIGKHVITNWLSMSGGVAKAVLDAPTINALGNTVAIDHYVHDPKEMKEYIDYFYNTFHAQVVIGEFGAPIPDINGNMTDKQQADFVNSVFTTLYQERTKVYGINYWVLRDSSTALADSNDILKPVANIIKQFYTIGM